jgi:hypothetical protein
LSGAAGDDLLLGRLGRDLMFGSEGSDKAHGGDGSDSIAGGAGNGALSGDARDDTITCDAGLDSISGGDGNDLLDGGIGADTIGGGTGSDTIIGGIGDVVDGGEDPDKSGTDVLDLTSFGFSRLKFDYDLTNAENGIVTFYETDGVTPAGTMTFTNIEKVIACFTPGTVIVTLDGEVAVEALRPGDLVLTRDNGYLPLSWVGRRDFTAHEMAAHPAFRPVRIARGALGQGVPEAEMIVSPQHRMLMTGPRAQVFFVENEVLVPAVHMVKWPGVSRVTEPAAVSYLHVMFEDHQIICANGAWTESFQPGSASLSGLDEARRDELLALFPPLARGQACSCARISLKAHEARLLMPV